MHPQISLDLAATIAKLCDRVCLNRDQPIEETKQELAEQLAQFADKIAEYTYNTYVSNHQDHLNRRIRDLIAGNCLEQAVDITSQALLISKQNARRYVKQLTGI